jgi:hypothetical protein
MRLVLVLAVAVAALALAAAPGFAANPDGAGQPNQSCEEQPSGPPGFDSGGFANAELNYAGNGSGSAHANSGNAVSQYDVACFQVSQR